MPIITFSNVNEEVVKNASVEIVSLLASSLSVPDERISFRFDPSTYYQGGQVVDNRCFIKVELIDRPSQVRSVLTTILSEFIKKELDIESTIIFEVIDPKYFYIDGVRFDQK